MAINSLEIEKEIKKILRAEFVPKKILLKSQITIEKYKELNFHEMNAKGIITPYK